MIIVSSFLLKKIILFCFWFCLGIFFFYKTNNKFNKLVCNLSFIELILAIYTI
jgi:hypothetical protein